MKASEIYQFGETRDCTWWRVREHMAPVNGSCPAANARAFVTGGRRTGKDMLADAVVSDLCRGGVSGQVLVVFPSWPELCQAKGSGLCGLYQKGNGKGIVFDKGKALPLVGVGAIVLMEPHLFEARGMIFEDVVPEDYQGKILAIGTPSLREDGFGFGESIRRRPDFGKFHINLESLPFYPKAVLGEYRESAPPSVFQSEFLGL